MTEITKLIGAAWRKLSDAKKAEYSQRAKLIAADSAQQAAAAAPTIPQNLPVAPKAAAAAPQLPIPQNPPLTTPQEKAAAKNDPRFWVFVEQVTPEMGIDDEDSLAYAWIQMEEDEKVEYSRPKRAVADDQFEELQRLSGKRAAVDDQFEALQRLSATTRFQDLRPPSLPISPPPGLPTRSRGSTAPPMPTNVPAKNPRTTNVPAKNPRTSNRLTDLLSSVGLGAVSSVAETASSWIEMFRSKPVVVEDEYDFQKELGDKTVNIKVNVSDSQAETLNETFKDPDFKNAVYMKKDKDGWKLHAGNKELRDFAMVYIKMFTEKSHKALLE